MFEPTRDSAAAPDSGSGASSSAGKHAPRVGIVPGLTEAGTLLMGWYRAYQRDLPWRRTRDPWAILVSEIMLQQTTVTAVKPYYQRFLKRWPRPVDLAEATRDEVMSEWQGLGYYRRADMLRDAAYAVAEAGGEMPRTADALRELPGVGVYTAAAVASIAYGERIAAIDGNVERVVTRLLALPGNPRKSAVRKAIALASEALMDGQDPGQFNQAVMDLGSKLCRPKHPRCEACPLSEGCLALAEGKPDRYPHLPERERATEVTRLAAVIRERGKVLMERRREPPNEGFLELPAINVDANVVDAKSSAPLFMRSAEGPGPRLVRHMKQRHGLMVYIDRRLPLHRHTITRYRITVHPFAASLSSGRISEPLGWIDPDDSDQPLTTATRRVLAAAWPGEYGHLASSPAQRDAEAEAGMGSPDDTADDSGR